ncbi:Enoyl-(Acyl carrier protein) reductase-like protein 27 [Elsinoe fawcettii]|nr:Enoyl-(Acyl carrier protein) reductase-like protein 27 [Elsinoe fawcettii]
MSFTGRNIAITGAARGIGRATTIWLAERGASLSLTDVLKDELFPFRDELSERFPQATFLAVALDVGNSTAVEEWMQKTTSELGPLHGAVNLAGIMRMNSSFVDIKDRDWDDIIRINLTGTMYCMRAQLKHISDGGSIINASSIAGLMSGPGVVAYAASKAAIISLTKSAAREYGARNIRINAICPGGFQTAMVQLLADAGMTDKAVMGRNCIERYGELSECAALIGFLLGDDSKFMTGDAIRVDGGFLT